MVIKTDPKNARKHGERNQQTIRSSLEKCGAGRSIVLDGEDCIIAGNGVYQQAQALGLPVRVIETDGTELIAVKRTDIMTGDDKRKLLALADNRTAELAEWDNEALDKLLCELPPVDLDGIGFSAAEIDALINDSTGDDNDSKGATDNPYTNKIISPIYTPKGDRPPLTTLIDRTKTDKLISEIDSSDIPQDIKIFLKHAAERHTVFHFGRIAEYYCHADKTVQDLMEKSAMIIIDFNKAIEYGFVHMTERLGKLADLYEDSEDA